MRMLSARHPPPDDRSSPSRRPATPAHRGSRFDATTGWTVRLHGVDICIPSS